MTQGNGWSLKPQDVRDVIESIPSDFPLRPSLGPGAGPDQRMREDIR
ncbi:MAG: hypothetical protein ACRDKS_01490 [Actinomycetota bacterium]